MNMLQPKIISTLNTNGTVTLTKHSSLAHTNIISWQVCSSEIDCAVQNRKKCNKMATGTQSSYNVHTISITKKTKIYTLSANLASKSPPL